MTHLVLAGAGHAQVEALRQFARRPRPGTRLTLVTREAFAPYSGMLPGLVAGLYGFADAHIDAAGLARTAGAEFVLDEVCGVDAAQKLVLRRNGPPISYDVLSLDTGARPDASVPGAEQAIAVKPIDRFLEQFEAMAARLGGSSRVAVVGAGAGGVELMLAAERRLRGGSRSFVLVAGSPDILPGFPAPFRQRLRAILAARGIEVLTNSRVSSLDRASLQTASGPVTADEVLWTTQAAAASWVRESGLPVDSGGFLRVDGYLQVVGQPSVFAAGDMTDAAPKSGVYAVRAGPVLGHNLRAALDGKALRWYRPQRRALYIVSTGERHGVATRNGVMLEGDWVWRVKDWLDRRFVARFNNLL